MLGTRTTIRNVVGGAALALLAMSGLAAQQQYLPLSAGNTWIYRASWPGGPDVQVTVEPKPVEVEGQSYWELKGWPGTESLLLRRDEEDRYWRRVEEGEVLFLDPRGELGSDAAQPPDDCSGVGKLETRAAKVTTPLGEFENVLRIRYNQGPCADAGVESDEWLPGVGWLRRTSQSIAGPQTLDLVYARLGGVTVISTGELSFGLSIDRSEWVPDDVLPVPGPRTAELNARISLRNTLAAPVILEFPSGQDFDLALKNEKGEVVWRWSADKGFIALFRRVEFGPGERNWTAKIPLTQEGKPLPAGKYVVEAELSTAGTAYKASLPFVIRGAVTGEQ